VVAVFSRTPSNDNLVEVRRWNGSSWVSDGVESGYVADWTHVFATPVTTTSIPAMWEIFQI
jgi:hypothetical protein